MAFVDLSNGFEDIETLIEYLYIIGLHKEAVNIALLADQDEFIDQIKKDYADNSILHDNQWQLFKDKIGSGSKLALIGTDEYEFLAYNAFKLSGKAKILEVGAYRGGTTCALCEGSMQNQNQITSVDCFIGTSPRRTTTQDCMNWNQNLWQKNVKKYSNRLRSISGSATAVLNDLVRQGEKFDLIFLDTAHGCETPFEIALISCLATDNCVFLFDDIINHNSDMTSAWAIAIKNFLAFPRFHGHLAAANFKKDLLPLNLKFAISSEEVTILKDIICKACEKDDLSTFLFQ